MAVFSSPEFYRKIFILSFAVLPLLFCLATPQGYIYGRLLSVGMTPSFTQLKIAYYSIALLVILILLVTSAATLTGLIIALRNKSESLLALNLKNLIFCAVNMTASGYIFMLILAFAG